MPSDTHKLTDGKKDPTEQEILIEEKKTKPNGEVQIRKYVKGRFLGKVGCTIHSIYLKFTILISLLKSPLKL